MVFETERSCNCAFVGSVVDCGILAKSTLRSPFIIFVEMVCRVFTRGPRALITAIARIGSLLLATRMEVEEHWFILEDGEESVQESLTFCFQGRDVDNGVIEWDYRR